MHSTNPNQVLIHKVKKTEKAQQKIHVHNENAGTLHHIYSLIDFPSIQQGNSSNTTQLTLVGGLIHNGSGVWRWWFRGAALPPKDV